VSGTGRASGRRFDRDHGVTTQALFLLSQLGSPRGEAYSHATHYEPVPVEAFCALLARVSSRFVRAATFVDVGSGMGRGVLLASEYPFKQVAGIELSPALHAIASANLAAAHSLQTQCRDVRLRCADARRTRFPKGNLVVFLFNPFDDVVVRAVLERILASRSERDEVLLLYHVPVHRDVVAEYAGEVIADTADGIVVRLTRSREGRDPSASRCSAVSRSPRNR
jgi:SAM-dependent methyltransferase